MSQQPDGPVFPHATSYPQYSVTPPGPAYGPSFRPAEQSPSEAGYVPIRALRRVDPAMYRFLTQRRGLGWVVFGGWFGLLAFLGPGLGGFIWGAFLLGYGNASGLVVWLLGPVLVVGSYLFRHRRFRRSARCDACGEETADASAPCLACGGPVIPAYTSRWRTWTRF